MSTGKVKGRQMDKLPRLWAPKLGKPELKKKQNNKKKKKLTEFAIVY